MRVHNALAGHTSRLGMAMEATFRYVRGYDVYKDIWAASGET